ncbi:hypothetical protein PISMIDRAFT_22321 [Pisolithus microcarpus 441]|uniref:Uncharacterized protein n=1 Tax=Pisolithus microcarpus 441 TaxID=765257 RepID=A0A0C9YPE9_9AGAM|nr:hypothetical protein PISMIDRAFT_22321 [Pisolithus microcarpus 441]
MMDLKVLWTWANGSKALHRCLHQPLRQLLYSHKLQQQYEPNLWDVRQGWFPSANGPFVVLARSSVGEKLTTYFIACFEPPHLIGNYTKVAGIVKYPVSMQHALHTKPQGWVNISSSRKLVTLWGVQLCEVLCRWGYKGVDNARSAWTPPMVEYHYWAVIGADGGVHMYGSDDWQVAGTLQGIDTAGFYAVIIGSPPGIHHTE